MRTRNNPNQEGLSALDYREALTVQDACNLSGVVHAWSRVLDKIWFEARAAGQGTDYVNRHPISVLFADKLADLAGTRPTDYLRAYDVARRKGGLE